MRTLSTYNKIIFILCTSININLFPAKWDSFTRREVEALSAHNTLWPDGLNILLEIRDAGYYPFRQKNKLTLDLTSWLNILIFWLLRKESGGKALPLAV